jgi:hypothetical protein
LLRRQDARVGEIVNLRTVKKQREQRKQAEAARQNRVRHGRSATQKANDRREEQRRQALLDASRRDEAGE